MSLMGIADGDRWWGSLVACLVACLLLCLVLLIQTVWLITGDAAHEFWSEMADGTLQRQATKPT
jgi:hypothetical protein